MICQKIYPLSTLIHTQFIIDPNIEKLPVIQNALFSADFRILSYNDKIMSTFCIPGNVGFELFDVLEKNKQYTMYLNRFDLANNK
jgi:hypothetical protein